MTYLKYSLRSRKCNESKETALNLQKDYTMWSGSASEDDGDAGKLYQESFTQTEWNNYVLDGDRCSSCHPHKTVRTE